MRPAAILALVWLIAGMPVAHAQSKADLQATATQAAQQYGVPTDLFLSQIQGESSFNPNIGCNKVGACGIAQFLPGTAQQFGVNTSDPTSSLYGAAQYDAQLFQQYGSWTTALTKYTGGLSPGNTAGNAAYAQAFTAAQQADSNGITTVSATGQQVDFGGGTDTSITSSSTDPTASTGAVGVADVAIASPDPTNGSSGVSLGSGPGSAASSTITTGSGIAPATTVTASGTTLSTPFSWAYSYVQSSLLAPLTNGANQVLSAVQPAITVVAVLAIAIMGMLMALGIIGPGDVMLRWLRIIGVVGLLANTADYNTYVTHLVITDIPQWFSSIFDPGRTLASPAATFDAALLSSYHATQLVHAVSFGDGIVMGIAKVFFLFIVIVVLVVMFAVFVVLQTLMAVVLLVAPILLLGLMFEYTRRFVNGLVNAIVGLLLSAFAVNAIVAILTAGMSQVFGSIQAGINDWDTFYNLIAAGISLAIIGAIVPIAARVMHSLSGAADHGVRAANPIGAAATLGTAALAAPIAATAGPAAAGAAITRVGTAVGRSLSSSVSKKA
jgi:type IV secretory pathway VirB6-like protein